MHFTLVTPEARPLAVFGPPASTAAVDLLRTARIDFVGSSFATPRKGFVDLEPGGARLRADRVVALPALRGRIIKGVPRNDRDFIPTDTHGRVRGVDAVYAAGDATTFPIKQGGIAAQQADAVAEAVAAQLGVPVAPRPFEPVLRGQLFTGGDDRFLRTAIGGCEGDGTMAPQPLWWPPTKVAGLYLAPYLLGRDEAEALGRAPAGFTNVEVPLTAAVESART